MRKKIIKRVFAVLLLLLINSIYNTDVLAMDQISVKDFSDAFLVETGGLFENKDNLLPGDKILKDFLLKNDTSDDLMFYLLAKPYDALKSENELSIELISYIKLSIYTKKEDNSLEKIYSGSFSVNSENKVNPIELIRLRSNNSKEITALITVPEELNNKFQKVATKLNWEFYCKEIVQKSDDDEYVKDILNVNHNKDNDEYDEKEAEKPAFEDNEININENDKEHTIKEIINDDSDKKVSNIFDLPVPLVDNLVNNSNTTHVETENELINLTELKNDMLDAEKVTIVVDNHKIKNITIEDTEYQTILKPVLDSTGVYSFSLLGILILFRKNLFNLIFKLGRF